MDKELVSKTIEEFEGNIVIYEKYLDETYTWLLLSKNQTKLLNCTTTNDKVKIPETVELIDTGAFETCHKIKEIVLPNKVTSIGKCAFSNCTELSKIKIPDMVTSIGPYAFSNCTELSKIKIPDMVTSIGDYAFGGCKSLTEIKIPDEVISIGKGTFARCNSLTEITLPNSITSLEDNMFKNCSGLQKITFPDTVTSIERSAFENCIELKEIIIPNSVNIIGIGAFKNCRELVDIKIPDSVTSIENLTFADCVGLKEITLPNTITHIGIGAFQNCSRLKEITLPNVVTSIERSAFENCRGLKEITLPNTIKSIENNILKNCSGLQEIIIPNTVTSIGAHSFEGCINLKKIIIPNSVNTIGIGAFSNCEGLTEMTLPNTITSINIDTFRGCTELSDITLPNTLTHIGECAFHGCFHLKKIVLPNTVASIDRGAFSNCAFLTEITLSDSLTNIADDSFSHCMNLKEITIPDTVTYIGAYSFEGCINLKEIIIPNSVTYLGLKAFGNCPALESVKFKNFKFNNIHEIPEFKNELDFYRELSHKAKIIENYHITLMNNGEEYPDNSDISIIFNELLKKIPEENILSIAKYLEELNISTFDNNIQLLKKYGFSNEKIMESIAYGNNYELLNIPLEYAMKNYNYLIEQNKISKENLDKIIFGNISGENFMEKMINYYQLFGTFPESFKTLMTSEENQLELRDRLEYISISCVQNENINYSNARLMFNRTLFENITEYDKEKFNKIDSENGPKILNKYPQMKGILEPFYEKLSGIDENWYNELIIEIIKDNNTIFNNFFNSLNTIKNWNNIPDERERATRLKNELIGKLLYTKISYLCTKHNLENAKITKLRKIFNSTYIPIEELLKLSTMSSNGKTITKKQVGFDNVERVPLYEYQENNPNLAIINKLLEIDPYAFDIFKNAEQSSKIESIIAALAKNNGYLFTQQDIKNYLEQLKEMDLEETLKEFSDYKNNQVTYEDIKEIFTAQNTKTHFKEYLSNQVGIPKIPTENKSEYLQKVRMIAKNYANNNTSEELINFTSALDLYLRANSEYLFQSREDDQELVSKIVFDRNSPIDDNSKILYSLYNLNKLAHNSSEIHLLSYLENKHRLSKDKQAETTNKLQSAINSYVSLSKYGLTNEQINILLTGTYDYTDNSKVFSQGEIYSLNQFFSKEKQLSILDNSEIDLIEKILEEEKINGTEQTSLFPDDLQKLKQAQIQKQLKKYFSKIAALSEQEKIQLNNFVEESKTFYECKQIFAQEIMNKLTKNIANKFENIMFADIKTKQQFYTENGFIAEVQYDESGNLVLACISEQFNEPFSVHLKDLDESTKQRFINNIKPPTISHVKLHGKGLTLRDDSYDNFMNIYSSSDNFIGFNNSYEMLGQAMRSNYDMYDIPAKILRGNKNLNNLEESEVESEKASQIEEMFSDEQQENINLEEKNNYK